MYKRQDPGRPIEEDLIEPPFKRKTMPQSSGSDAEDFWQEMGRYNQRPGIFEDGIDGDGESDIREWEWEINNQTGHEILKCILD